MMIGNTFDQSKEVKSTAHLSFNDINGAVKSYLKYPKSLLYNLVNQLGATFYAPTCKLCVMYEMYKLLKSFRNLLMDHISR